MDSRPKKSLGQNFLVDPNYRRKIIGSLGPLQGKGVLEIGPGRGVLTRELVEKCGRLILVEKDNDLVPQLGEWLPEEVTLHHADFLDIDLAEGLEGLEKVIALGNLPYNVASQIFLKLVQHRSYFSDFFLMFQKEMALRFVAKPSTKDYGLLTLWAGVYTEPKILFHLPPTVFKPQPKVTSSFVHFKIKDRSLIEGSEEPGFWALMRLLFQQRRKTMGAVLKKKKIAFPEAYQKARAEELTVEELIGFFRGTKIMSE